MEPAEAPLGQSGPLLLEFVETFLEPLSQKAMTIQEPVTGVGKLDFHVD